ncbi:hypothetical protein IW261DRAFT_1574709 [Armillaria novae-zelandiae]|uniref:Uncharacterized protein n=1 Tax=Armillaria novae-zelandiae TaxID=153914 RepID=A0AA39NI00_9AGAR|nr:hypothetical protein IW261DRAFT_1574709 [Armillaria novae-zelandiae]
MSDSELIPSHRAPMSDICDNLVSARALTARYFELEVRTATATDQPVRVLNKVHVYLDVHMGILQDFQLVDSRYGIALRTLVCLLVGRIPAGQRPLAWRRWFLTDAEMDRNDYELDESLSLPGEEGYIAHGDHSVLEVDVRPFHCLILPPPRRPMVAPVPVTLPVPPEDPVQPVSIPTGPAVKKKPCPTMVKKSGPPKEPALPPISTQMVEDLIHPSVSPPPAPPVSKRKHAQGSAAQLLADDSGVKKSTRSMKSSAPIPSVKSSKPVITKRGTRTSARKAKVAPAHEPLAMLAKIQMLAHSSGNVDLSDSGDEDSTLQDIVCNDPSQETEEIMAQPIKRVRLVSPVAISPPPARAYHPLTGEPLTGLTYISLSALSEPVQPFPVAGTSSKGKSKGKARVAALPAPAVVAPVSPVAAIVDNTIYARGFHPDINLQFHEPPSREALECMKMSLLPAAPDSLTKPPSQVCSGREYIYHCHSDPNPYFIRAPLLNWPCFNCTLAGMPDECIFEGGVGEECCTHCKSNRHGPCSARWDANQLRSAATLLDPLTLSGDGSIFCGVRCVEHLNEQLEHLGHLTNQLHADRDQVVAELADSLDAISAREHGMDIIDAYAGVSEFLKSFIIRPGESASQSPACGSAATCLSDDGADEDRSFDDE